MKNKFSKQEIQKILWKFIGEFRDELAKKCSEYIDFIIIYGSAVRGEFVPGKSDVDIVVQIFENEKKDSVEKSATDIFWKTVKKYPELKFEDSLSVAVKKEANWMEKLLKKVEKSSFLYVPVFVFAKGEIDWTNGKIITKNPLISIGKQLIVPERSVFLKFKKEGKILYGRDIRKEIKIRLNLFERLRLGGAPQLLSFIGFLISFFVPSKAKKYTVKALLYEIDALYSNLRDYEKALLDEKIAYNQKILLNEFTEQLENIVKFDLDYRKGILREKDFELFKMAVKLKWNEIRLNYCQTIYFCLRAWWFIIRLNLRAIACLLLFRRNY